MKVKDLVEFANALAPFYTKTDWDNCGLLVGDPEHDVNKVGFCLDITPQSLQSAVQEQVDMVITHHPIIFRAQKNFLKGNFAYELARSGISVLSIHTCYDAAPGGVNDILCESVGLRDVVVLPDHSETPILRLGKTEKTDAFTFAQGVAQTLHTTVRVGDSGKPIETVAVCSGSGGSLLPQVLQSEADAFLTGEADHHHILDAVAQGVSMIIAGHFETENPSMVVLRQRVRKAFPDLETVMLQQNNPVQFIG